MWENDFSCVWNELFVVVNGVWIFVFDVDEYLFFEDVVVLCVLIVMYIDSGGCVMVVF